MKEPPLLMCRWSYLVECHFIQVPGAAGTKGLAQGPRGGTTLPASDLPVTDDESHPTGWHTMLCSVDWLHLYSWRNDNWFLTMQCITYAGCSVEESALCGMTAGARRADESLALWAWPIT